MGKNYHTDNKTFMLYKDWAEYFDELDSKDAGDLLKALFKFAATGEEADFTGILKFMFMFMKNTIDRDGKAWESACEARAENGKKGGRPKKPTGFSENQEKAKKADTDTDIDIDTDIVTEKDTVPPAPQALRQEGRRSPNGSRSLSGSRSADKNKNKYDPNKPSYDLEKLVEYALYNTPVLKKNPEKS